MKDILKKYFSMVEMDKPFRVVFPDGDDYRSAREEPAFEIHFKTWKAIDDLLVKSNLGFGEAYMAEDIDLIGDVQDVAHLGFIMADNDMIKPSFMEMAKIMYGYFIRKNTLEGSRKNISAHYDLGNDFYKLWLDEELQYTCAYFHSEKDTLEQAQKQKMDLVCRKLRLQPGETVIEAGCGWGHFAIHAAKNYGVKMKSFNISKEQIEHAREMARKHGLGPDQVEFIQDDYRIIENEGIQYDKFVSIGMLEHVGRENYGRLYDIIHKVLKPNGLAMVHTIGKVAPVPTDPWLEKHIFPGGYIPSLAEIVKPIEVVNRPLYVADVENLRYHYALTLDHWSERFEQHVDQIRAQYDEAFVRKFRLYLRGSAAGFRWGGILLYQVLLSNGFDNTAPLTRHHFYTHSSKSPARLTGEASPINSASTKGTKKATKKSGKKETAKSSSKKSVAKKGSAKPGKKKNSKKKS